MPSPSAPMPLHVVQIAGVIDAADAQAIVDAGADWIGFPFGLDHHAEDLPPAQAAAIIRGLPAKVRPLLITYVVDPAAVIALAEALGVTAVQLHGPVTVPGFMELRRLRPDWLLLKSLVVGRDDLGEAVSYAPHADAFLTDTYDPPTGASGATGRAHDWQVSAGLARKLDRPLVLAGGLTPGNVAEAIAVVQPWGVDAHTGVEDRTGRKCPQRLQAFVEAARQAWRGG